VQRRTAAVALGLVAALAAVAVVGVGGGVSVEERWISDTARDNRVNHHAAAVGPNGSVLAPVSAVVGAEAIGPTSCSLLGLEPDDGGVEWRGTVPAQNCTTHAITAPAIGDAGGDDGLETAVATTERALIVRDLTDGSEEWRVPLPTYGYGRPVITELDGERAVVAVDIRGTVVVARDGEMEWQESVDDAVWASPIVTDADADGRSEVIVTANHALVAYDAEGTVEWRAATGGQSATLANVDEDQASEIIVANGSGVTVVDSQSGAIQSTVPIETQTRIAQRVTADGDEQTIYLGLAGGTVTALDPRTGEVRWRTVISDAEQLTPAPRLADVTGDGEPELIAAANDGTVAVLDPETGEQRASYERDVLLWAPVATGDIDDDGAAEVIVRYGDGRVVRLDVTG